MYRSAPEPTPTPTPYPFKTMILGILLVLMGSTMAFVDEENLLSLPELAIYLVFSLGWVVLIGILAREIRRQ